jgi:hypothetical protein
MGEQSMLIAQSEEPSGDQFVIVKSALPLFVSKTFSVKLVVLVELVLEVSHQ